MQREYKISLSQEFYSDVVYLSQYDSDYDVIFKVMNKLSAVDVDGKSAKFTGTRKDGLGFTFETTGTGSYVSFEINTSLTAVAGHHTAEIVFYDSQGLYFGSANVQVVVEPAARKDGTIDADTERAQEIAEEIQEIVDNAAAEVKGEAESWAVGERDGEPVPATDPAYNNNAKYYAQQAAQIAEDISGVTEQVAQNTSDIGDLKEDLNSEISARESAVSSETARAEAEEARIEALFTGDVSEAVNDWLDAHPEATTTVVDHSLTLDKFVLGVNGFVTPEQFGAKGDGITDDTDAVRDAIAYGKANNCAVFIPQKTYIITHDRNTVTLLDGQSVVIFGAGQNSIIKRKNDSLESKWNRLFVFQTGACESAHANDVILSNFCIDSNRRNQSAATSGYDHEAAGDVIIQNGTGLTDSSYQYIDRVILKDMRFYDPVADCFGFSGSGQVNVKNVWLDGMVASGRQATRNDIGFTGNPLGDVWIQDCKVSSIHFEYNQTVSDENIVTFHFDSVTTGSLSLGGRIDAILTNVHSNQLLLSDYRHIIVDGCILDLTHTNNYMYNSGNPNNQLDILNSLIINKYYSSDSKWNLYFRALSNVTIRSCTFDVVGDDDIDMDGDETNDHVTMNAFTTESFLNSTITIDSCIVSPRFRALFAVVAGATYNIRNMELNTGIGWTFGVLTGSGKFTNVTLNLQNIILGHKCTKAFIVNAFNGPPVFVFNGDLICKEQNFSYSVDTSTAGSNFVNALTGTFKRLLKLSAPLDFPLLKSIFGYTDTAKHNYNFFKGDELEYTDEATPYKWVAKNTGTTTTNTINGVTGSQKPLSQRFKTFGSATGDTASRPTCILDKGFTYYDTDLSKLIMWDGATWVNIDGTALLA